MRACVYVCVCINCSSGAMYLFFETESLTGLELIKQARLTGWQSPEICLPLLSDPPELELQVHATTPCIFMWFLGTELKFSVTLLTEIAPQPNLTLATEMNLILRNHVSQK